MGNEDIWSWVIYSYNTAISKLCHEIMRNAYDCFFLTSNENYTVKIMTSLEIVLLNKVQRIE